MATVDETKRWSRKGIRNLAAQFTPRTGDELEKLVSHIDALQDQGIYLGYDTCVWHESSVVFKHACPCSKCNPRRIT